MTPDQSMLNATLLGYVAGLAWGERPDGPDRNPYAYVQIEAYNWQHGFEQGSNRREQCGVTDPLPLEPFQITPLSPPNGDVQDTFLKITVTFRIPFRKFPTP